MSGLIDTTAANLRIIYELEEAGVAPRRARIAQRLGHSGPTVRETVARIERNGLLIVMYDHRLELTAAGRVRAVSVMRKHRLAERLLVDVIGLRWDLVHAEASRWEHVMSDAVERRIVDLLGGPEQSPYGNPIPGLGALTGSAADDEARPMLPAQDGLLALVDLALTGGGQAVVRRIEEWVQDDRDMLRELLAAGLRPGREMRVARTRRWGEPVEVTVGATTTALARDLAGGVLISQASDSG